MLPLLSLICSIIATVCAFMSPVIICHWLLKLTDAPIGKPFVQAGDPLIVPLVQLLDGFFPALKLTINGHTFSPTEAIVAISFTVAFFVFHFLSEFLKMTNQRIIVDIEARKHMNNLNRMRRESERQKTALKVQDWKIQAYVRYDAATCPAGWSLIKRVSDEAGVNVIQEGPQGVFYQFSRVGDSIACSQKMILSLKQYYAGLRPIDPQPPLSIGIHAINQNSASSLSETERVVSFAGPHQVVFSQTFRDLLDAEDLQKNYVFQSIGIYSIGQKQEEMFRLEPGKVAGPQDRL
jgi:hypothetical protein